MSKSRRLTHPLTRDKITIAMSPQELEQLAAQLVAGNLSMEDFVHRASYPHTADVGHAKIDLDRHRRCGFSEVVFAEGKTVAALEQIFDALVRHGVADVFSTRMSAEQFAQLKGKFPAGQYNPVARTFRIPRPKSVCGENNIDEGHERREKGGEGEGKTGDRGRRVWSAGDAVGQVTIVTAGTTDLPVAEEARETALWTGAQVTMIQDVGVAGPHRLTANLPLLRDADAIVVVAGMEGALPSVVGGHVACPVIAVPTSVGYGAAFGGVAALLGMLNSCASNVTVVNIDAGFKGGYVAGLIAKNVAKARGNRPARTH
jgi:pyridinium-3,5-biscarboxylic acid mononucleotide synthase